MAKGASVIPGARNLRQVESNLRPRDFKLSAAQARPPSRMRAHARTRARAHARTPPRPVRGVCSHPALSSRHHVVTGPVWVRQVARLDKAAARVPKAVAPEANPFPKKDVFTGLTMYDS